jgi:hypothetical protein
VGAWEGFALWVQTRSDIALTVRVHHHRKSVVLCEGRAWKMPDPPTDKSASDRARILTEFGTIPRWDICVHLGQLNTVHGFEAIQGFLHLVDVFQSSCRSAPQGNIIKSNSFVMVFGHNIARWFQSTRVFAFYSNGL